MTRISCPAPSPQRGEGRGEGFGSLRKNSTVRDHLFLRLEPTRARVGHPLPSSRRVLLASEFCQSQVHEKPFARKATRVLKWSAGRRRGRGPRHANGCCHPPTLRAWRAPQNDPLARTACFGRAAPPGAPPPSRFSTAAVDRRCASSAPAPPAGVVNRRPYGEREDSSSYW